MCSCDQCGIGVTIDSAVSDGAAGSGPVGRISIKEHEMFSKIGIPHGWLVAFPRFEKALQLLKKSRKYVDSDWAKLDHNLQMVVFDKLANLVNRRGKPSREIYGAEFTEIKSGNRHHKLQSRIGKIALKEASFSKHQKRAMTPRSKPSHCEACGEQHKKICWDHDHAVGKFRGWICSDCNTALGFAHDSVDRLNKLAAYLQGAATNQAPRILSGVFDSIGCVVASLRCWHRSAFPRSPQRVRSMFPMRRCCHTFPP